MKKTAMHGISQMANRKRGLQLSTETIRTLGGGDLSRVVAGCDTTSYTTEKQTDGASARNCGQQK